MFRAYGSLGTQLRRVVCNDQQAEPGEIAKPSQGVAGLPKLTPAG
jgi:hypothetical protein